LVKRQGTAENLGFKVKLAVLYQGVLELYYPFTGSYSKAINVILNSLSDKMRYAVDLKYSYLLMDIALSERIPFLYDAFKNHT